MLRVKSCQIFQMLLFLGELWRQIWDYLGCVGWGVFANPNVAPNVANWAELKAPETFFVLTDGLKTHSAPQQVSYNQYVTMPFVRPKKEEFLNLYNIMLVTQKKAGTPEHLSLIHI